MKAQAWSMDVLIATFIFIVIFILFFGVLNVISQSERERKVKEESELLAEVVTTDSSVGFVKSNKVDTERLKAVQDTNYTEIKRDLNLQNDFCIYFEDEQGNLVTLRTDDGTEINSVGSSDAKLGGVPCGS